jgi:predicted nucleotide-binding protein
MEQAIDQKVAAYRGNEMVEELATQMKENYRQQIEAKAAEARSESDNEPVQQELGTVYRQIENIVSDLRWADHSSFIRQIKKLSRTLHTPELEPVTAELIDGIDLEAWIKAGEATQGGMVGSAELDWPAEARIELGTVILLIDRFAGNPDSAVDFAHTFYYNGSRYTDNLQNMTAQMIVPFARDYIEYAKRMTGAPELVALPTRAGARARKVFVVHGHDDGARESVARFLEKIGFQAIILHEQANQGRTIIEKVEAYADVGFAVVLLTPDDEGGVKGGPMQARARQNVILELGYFIGRLGRSRVMALRVGDVEIPSDFHGVVYEPYASGGPWTSALGRELEAAGFEIDWNLVMKR